MPALVVATQALGEPRYPSLKGIMAARSKTIATWSLADLGLDPATLGGAVATTRSLGAEAPPARAATRIVREPAAEAAARSSTSSPSGGSSDGPASGSSARSPRTASLARISTEVATLARTLASGGRDGRPASSSRRTRRPPRPSSPPICRGSRRSTEPAAADHVAAARGAAEAVPRATLGRPVLIGASPDGRDVAGILSALLGWGVLVNATAVTWDDGGPVVEMSVFGGKLLDDQRRSPADTASSPSARTSSRAEPAATPGRVETRRPGRPSRSCPQVQVLERVAEAGARRARSRRPGSSSPADAASAGRMASARRGAGRGARRRRRRDPRGRRLGLDPVRPADRPDRQDRQAGALRRARHLAARSSTRSGCRPPTPSSPSTATPTRRSPSSPTCSSWATCSRSCRRSWRR